MSNGFHGGTDRERDVVSGQSDSTTQVVKPPQTETIGYRFTTHFHPYVRQLVEALNAGDVKGLQEQDTLNVPGSTTPLLYDGAIFPPYNPHTLVDTEHPPVYELDFSSGGAYAVYNWELFFHIPMAIAIRLSKNQRYGEAQAWFHHVFDPTDDSDGPAPEKFWRVRPLQQKDVPKIEQVLLNLSTRADDALWKTTMNAIAAWRADPFRPFLVARYRPTAYMYKAVMAYLDNLIAWGDSLFREDTGEAINEATQLYVLAAGILGPRPQQVPTKGEASPQTYNKLRGDLDAFGNALRDLESEIPFDLAPDASPDVEEERFVTIASLGKDLVFCVPRNDQLLAYWDTVADRLFKIRNSLDLQGVFRQLPLFEPPIDPALLAKAAAAGLDVAAVLAGVNQPLPLVRFQLLLQKATELCAEVKSLGGQLLAALEKEDNEALSILRARQERVILGLGEAVKYGQLQEAIKAREGLEQSIANAAQRYGYYERLLGKKASEVAITGLDAIDSDGLLKTKFKASEPTVAFREIVIQIDPVAHAGGHQLNPWETTELALQEAAQLGQDSAGVLDSVGAFLSLIPDISGAISPVGLGAHIRFGGSNLGHLFRGMSAAARTIAGRISHEAARAGKLASITHREEELALQSNNAAGEITQLFKQLRAAQIREAVAQREWTNHQQQVANAVEIEQFLTDERVGKRTNQALFTWMKGEVRGLHTKAFQLAFDVAKKAERALQHELGEPKVGFLEYSYLSGKEGLLAGEKLHLDLKRMELAYHDLNRREYELTRHVSLLELDPHALLRLRVTGRCTIRLNEELFDLDCPGHYFRRIKSVALSLPCVAGPFISVNATLSLTKSSIRTNSLLTDGQYGRSGPDDGRFSDHFGSLQAIVTSSGQSDTGLFETNLRDERYLPFEGSGAISEWQLELPRDIRQFDYATISDAVLHVRYTAREGGALLRSGAVAALSEAIDAAGVAGSVRLLSIRHDFPREWAKMKNSTATSLTIALTPDLYPFWARDRLDGAEVKAVEIFAAGGHRTIAITDASGVVDRLAADPSLGGLRVGRLTGTLPAAITDPKAPYVLVLDDNSMRELWLAVTWGAKE